MTTKHEVPVSPFVAFKAVCHAFGTEELADRIGMRRGTLHNKCDGDVESHHQPTLRDVIAVTRESGDMRVLDSLNRLFNRASFDVTPGPVSDQALLELLCVVASEKGQMHRALMDGLADAKFSDADYRLVRAEAFDLISAVMAFVQRLEGLVDA